MIPSISLINLLKICTNNSLRLSSPTRQFCTKQRSWRILFFGSGDVALASAKYLCSRKEKDTTAKIPTIEWAKKNNVSRISYIPRKVAAQDHEKSVAELANLASTEYDIGVVADFGYMIPKEVIQSFPFSPILMHPSLLPKYRGAAPIERCLMNGDKVTGVTVLDVHPSHFDAGKIMLVKSYLINPEDTAKKIRSDLAALGAQAIMETLQSYSSLKAQAVEQPSEGLSLAPKLRSSDFIANFDLCSPIELHFRIRALGSLSTVLFGCDSMKSLREDGGIVVLLRASFTSSDDVRPAPPVNSTPLDSLLNSKAEPGTIIFDKHRNLVWCKCGRSNALASSHDSWLAVAILQFESGHRNIDATSFANGTKMRQNKGMYFGQIPRNL